MTTLIARTLGRKPWAIALLSLFVGACATQPPQMEPERRPQPAVPAVPTPAAPLPAPAAPLQPPAKPSVFSPSALQQTRWDAIDGWYDDDLTQAWPAFLQSCEGLKAQLSWQRVCDFAGNVDPASSDSIRRYFQDNFTPYQTVNPDGTTQGLITGYYEPVLRASRTPSSQYRFPIYRVPADLITVDLSAVVPETRSMRLRGRVQGNKLVPYLSRAEIDSPSAPLKGTELYWTDDPVELFFMQIQGSAKLQLDTGETARVGYADQNGHPYRSIGRLLIDRGELPLEKTSLQGIKAWARANPGRVQELLNNNPSYIFFRDLSPTLPGPLGALGVPLTAERSIAVDPRYIPLGAPVFLATTYPNSTRPLKRLMMGQDTGGAIRGQVRADFYWGSGEQAGKTAGGMRQQGRQWVLLPNDYPLNAIVRRP